MHSSLHPWLPQQRLALVRFFAALTVMGCGGLNAPQVAGPMPAAAATAPTPAAAAAAPTRAAVPGAFLSFDDDGEPFELHRNPNGEWELAVQQTGNEERTVYLRPVSADFIGAPRLRTTYQIESGEAILSLMQGSPPRLVTAVYDRLGDEVFIRTMGSGALMSLGSTGTAGMELSSTIHLGIRSAVSSDDPPRGVALWIGRTRRTGHRRLRGGGHATTLTGERRRLRVAFFGGHSGVHTLVPYRESLGACGGGLRGNMLDSGGRAASWIVHDESQVDSSCEALPTLHAAWFGVGAVEQTAQQPIPAELTRDALGIATADDGSLVTLHRGQVENGQLTLGVLGFEPSGSPRPPSMTSVRAAGFSAFPVVRCGGREWLPYYTSNDDETIVLSTLELPMDGAALTEPVQRWESERPVRCLDRPGFATSVCAGGEVAVTKTCWVPDTLEKRIVFASWRAHE